MTAILNIRTKRQVTFPEPLLAMVGASVGDNLIAEIEDNNIVLKPQKTAAVDAFKALQNAFAESNISEKETQDNLKKIRREIYNDKYAQSLS